MRLSRLIPVLFLSVAACGAQPPPVPAPVQAPAKESPLTYANYQLIQNGMTEDQVRAVFGDPAQISPSDTPSDSSLILRWKGGDKAAAADSKATVTVYFKKGKVVSKEANLVK